MSYLYSSGVVSVKESQLLKKDFFLSLLSCNNLLEAENLIKNAFHSPEDISADEILDNQENELWTFVTKEAPNDMVKSFFTFPIVYDNIATICKAQMVGVDWENYVDNYSWFDNKKIASFVAKRDFSLFSKEIAEVVKTFFEKFTPQSSPEELDRYFKQNKYKIMRLMFKKGLLCNLTKLLCDKQNLSLCFRAKSKEDLLDNAVECGFLSKNVLQGIWDKDNYIIGQIAIKPLRKIAELIFENKDKALIKFEKEQNMLTQKFCEPLRYNMDSPAQFVYYVLSKSAEIKNCRMCLLFVRNNIAEKARQMLLFGD